MSSMQRVGLTLAVLMLLLAAAGEAGADGGASVTWAVLSGGGQPATGGSVSLSGSLGQTAIGPATSQDYGTAAGYWYGTGATYIQYFPLLGKNYLLPPTSR
jgi:hypothetical protein